MRLLQDSSCKWQCACRLWVLGKAHYQLHVLEEIPTHNGIVVHIPSINILATPLPFIPDLLPVSIYEAVSCPSRFFQALLTNCLRLLCACYNGFS